MSSKLQKQMTHLLKTEQNYYELIMAVESKFTGETRHETALRYITDRETMTINASKS